MANHDHRRYSDDTVSRIEQKLDDLIAKFDDHLKWADAQVGEDKCKFKDTSERLSAIENLLRKVDWPARTIGWIILTGATGSVLFFGHKAGEWLVRHW